MVGLQWTLGHLATYALAVVAVTLAAESYVVMVAFPFVLSACREAPHLSTLIPPYGAYRTSHFTCIFSKT